MASRNEDLYGYYLMAHIYSGGNCGDIAPQQMGRQSYPSADVRGNDAKAAVALGQMHGRAGTEALSMDRLVATVEGMVAWDPERTGDLSAAKAAMSDLAKVAEGLTPGACKVTVENMAGGETKPPNAGDLADMKAATQGLGVVTEKADSPTKSQWPLLDPKPSWVVGAYNTGDNTTVLTQAMRVLSEARARGEIHGDAAIMVSVSENTATKSGASAK